MIFAKPKNLVFLVGALVASAVSATDADARAPRGNWTESSLGSVRIVSTLPPAQAREAHQQLEQLLSLLEAFSDTSRQEIVVLAFDQHRSFARYAPFADARGVGGWFQSDGATSYLGIDRSLRGTWRETLLHEAVHAVLQQRDAPLPLWIEEGVAEFFATLASQRDQTRLGLPIERHLQLLRHHRWLPWDRVFEMTADSPDYGAALEGQLFYAQSWLLIHYLMVDAERSTQLHQIVSSDEESPATAALLGFDDRQLEVVLRRWAESNQFPYLRLPRQPETLQISTDELTEAGILARLGHLLANRVREPASLARKHFEAALQLDPTDRLALEGLMRTLGG